jgi:uncharacterized lipoprotein YddW (UPF0748 family)
MPEPDSILLFRRPSRVLAAVLATMLAACASDITFPVTPDGPDSGFDAGRGGTELPDAVDEADATESDAIDDDALLSDATDTDDTLVEDVDADAEPAPDVNVDVDVSFPELPPTDTGTVDERELVTVAHTREFRGMWIATVSNINFPSARGLNADALRAEIDGMVDLCAQTGINAIVFQVRPEGDALYASTLEPWSRYLTGTQGGDPGMDPLAYLLERAHEEAIEVHAWLNPYRARASSGTSLSANHMGSAFSQYAYNYRNQTWMDPGVPVVQQRLLDVVDDLITRYDVDGIHFDDYFYPYPDGPFPDSATYTAFQAGGGTLSLGDWRRDNVNQMVRRVHELITIEAPSVRFGIAPFGIYRPGIPAGINGLDQYDAIYADPLKWGQEGWVDYLAPQLYWPTSQTSQAYEPLLNWWTGINPDIYIFAGNYLSKIGENSTWSLAEFAEQLRISRSYGARRSLGNIWFQIAPLQRNTSGVRDAFSDTFYPTPASTPPLVNATVLPEPPTATRAGNVITLGPPAGVDVADIRSFGLYEQDGTAWRLSELLPASTSEVTVSGNVAISLIDRFSVESQAVVLAP